MGPWANPSNTSSSSSSETGSAKALKAGTALTVDGGNITIDSADDSIHTNDTVTINGGYIVIDVAGDGVDSNGSITMTNGTVIVNGPENSGNGALDYDTTFDISGGVFVAAGNNGMVQAPSTSSSQASINVSLPSSSSNSMVSILDASGNTILSFTPSKTYQSVVISTPELVIGSNYSVYYGGSNSGSESDGLYTDGSASGGTELINFTLSSSVMTVSSSGATEGVSGGMKGGGRPQR